MTSKNEKGISERYEEITIDELIRDLPFLPHTKSIEGTPTTINGETIVPLYPIIREKDGHLVVSGNRT